MAGTIGTVGTARLPGIIGMFLINGTQKDAPLGHLALHKNIRLWLYCLSLSDSLVYV
jgi:hypothetical protein